MKKAEHAHENANGSSFKIFARKFAHMFQLPLQMESILHKVVKLGST